MDKMKFSLIGKLLLACAMIVFLGGCTDKVIETVYVDLSLSRYSVVFPVSGGTTSITVGTSDNWSATTDATWLTLGIEGSTLAITAEANDQDTEIRTAEIRIVTVTSSGSATVQVRQEPGESPVITLSYGTGALSIDSEGGTFTVVVECNCDWSASLAEQIDGWELAVDTASGLVSVMASANSGDAVSGTIVITAGNLTEEVVVKQDSRAENPYFQFVDDWLITSDDCFYNEEWIGAGTNNSCTFAEFDYTTETLSMLNWGGLTGIQTDDVRYKADVRTFTVPMGYLCGSAYSGNSSYYMYLVAFNTEMNTFSTSSYLILTLSEDGKTATVSGLNEDYPVVGWVGYNSYYGYRWFNDLYYSMAPMSLSKAEEGTQNAVKNNSRIISPVTDLPEGIPARLPFGMTGEVSETVAF